MADGNVSIATLGIEFKPQGVAETNAALTATAETAPKTEAAVNKLTSAQAKMAEGARKASSDISGMLGAINGSVTQLVGMAKAQTDATAASAQAAQEMAAQQARVLQSIEATVAGVREFTAGLLAGVQAELKAAEAGRSLAAANKAAADSLEDLGARVARLRSAYDPLGVKLNEISAQMREADQLRRADAISAEEHAKAITALAERYRALNSVSQATAKTSGAMRFAMLDLSRQFADVGVSAAMGINPLMILIQQGPQIADAFQMAKASGVGFSEMLAGIAAKVGPVLAVLGGLAVVAAPIGVMVAAMAQGEAEAVKFSNAMKATGQAAGVTGDQFQAMVAELGHIEGFGKAREALLAVAASGKVAGDEIKALGELSLRVSSLTGESAAKVAAEWAGMGDDVAGFAAKHNEQYHLITAAQYEHIKLLQDEGRVAEAQAELIKAATTAMAQRGEADLGFLQKAWKGVSGAIDEAWENLKKFGAGGDQGLQNKIDQINQKIAAIGPNHLRQGELDALASQRNALQATLDAHHALAQSQAAENAAQDAGISAARRHAEMYATMGDNLARVNREIAKYRADQEAIRRANPQSAELDSPTRRAQIEADIRKKYTESLRATHRAAPTDRADSFDAAVQAQSAAVDQQIIAAKQAMLQALLKVTDSPEAKAAIQAQIDSATYNREIAAIDQKIAEIGKQIVAIQQAKLDTHAAGQVATLQGLQLTLQEAKIHADTAQKLKDIDEAWGLIVKDVQQAAQKQVAQLQIEETLLQGQADLSKSSYARGVIEKQLLALKRQELEAQQRVVDVIADPEAKTIAQLQLDRQRAAIDAQDAVISQNLTLANGLEETVGSVQSFSAAIKRHDWLAAFDDLMQALQTMQALMGDGGGGLGAIFSQFTGRGSSGGFGSLFSGFGGGGGSLADQPFAQGMDFLGGVGTDSFSGQIGEMTASMDSMSAGLKSATAGTGGMGGLGALGTAGGYGIAGMAVGGMSNSLFGLRNNTGSMIGGAVGGIAGGFAGGAMLGATMGSWAGPIGMAIGAVLGAALGSILGGKPSNHAAIAGLTPTSYSIIPNKDQNDDTVKAATALSQAILASEAALKAAGVVTKNTVAAVDIGQRDKTKITLSDGTSYRTNAVGDAAEAANTAMLKLLDGATYVSDTEKKLVESMADAGSSFDDIAKALQGYTAAQKMAGSIADQLLQLTDPEAYDKKQVTDAIQAQRDALQASADAGYYTADQFAGLNDQLDKIQGLQLDAVLKKYADTATQATNQWLTVSQRLQDWVASLTGQIATPAQSTAQTYAALQAAGLAARGGDLDAAGKVSSLGDSYLAAAKAAASSAFDYAQAVARARAIGSSVQTYAAGRAGFATGGSFTVGGFGAGDSQNFGPVSLSPGEVVNVSRGDSMAEVVAELKAVKAQLASLQADNRAGLTKLASNTGRVAKVIENWDGAGLPPDRTAEVAA